MNIWNLKNVPCPPHITVVYCKENLEKICHLTNEKFHSTQHNSSITNPENWIHRVRSLLANTEGKIEQVNATLLMEMKCLFSYLYQGGGVHKKEKYIHAAKKIGKCLKRWKDINLIKLLSNLKNMIPKEFASILAIRFPSPKLMYFLLHRLVGSFYLLMKALSYCRDAGVYFKAKIAKRHTIAVATLGYSIVARIRALVLDICNSIAVASDELHPCLMSMAEEGEVLIENLPSNLRDELGKFVEKKNDSSKVNQTTPESLLPRKEQQKIILTHDHFDLECDQEMPVDNVEAEEASETSKIRDDNYRDSPEHTVNSEDFMYSVAGCEDEDEDVGEGFSHAQFNTLKKLSESIIEAPKSIENRMLNGKSKVNKKDWTNLKFDSIKKNRKKKRKRTDENLIQGNKRKK